MLRTLALPYQTTASATSHGGQCAPSRCMFSPHGPTLRPLPQPVRVGHPNEETDVKKRLLMALTAGAMAAAMVPGLVSAQDAGTEATDGLDVGLFFEGALAEEVTTEDCTLSGGAETTCYRITVAGYPASHDVGPFCPETITDGADAGGIWFDGDGGVRPRRRVHRRPRRALRRRQLADVRRGRQRPRHRDRRGVRGGGTARRRSVAAEPLRRGSARVARERRADHHHGADPGRAGGRRRRRLQRRGTRA